MFALVLSWLTTIQVRLLLNPLFSRSLQRADLVQVAPPVYELLALWLFTALWLRGRKQPEHATIGTNVMHVAEGALAAGILVIVVTFFSHSLGAELSRSFVLLFLPVSFLIMILCRYAAILTITAMDERMPSGERIAVIGAGEEASEVVSRILDSYSGAAVCAGIILPERASEDDYAGSIPVLGTTASLAELINRAQLDRVVVAEEHLAEDELQNCAHVSRRMGVVLSRPVRMSSTNSRVGLTTRYGVPMVELQPVEFSRAQELVKRTFDVVASALAIVLLAPLLAAVAAAIRLTSEGPALYRSTRVGRGGRYFQFLKFRSMYINGARREDLAAHNEKSGHLFKMRQDPRVTSVGRFIRRWSIDELPQLINVLRGDMSMVGPRPLPACDLDPDGQSRAFAVWAEQRSRVLPGITGLWQIRGRSELPFDKMVELDVEYIRNWSLTLDFQILLETPIVLVTGRGAY
jgi:exopolysaccharide biosynthesis polyprenyl glycosylphosphotransferase